jgi:ribosomal protein L11 methyltransferase
MDYTNVIFKQITLEQSEILIALLANIEYEGFAELDDSLTASIPSSLFNKQELKSVCDDLNVAYEVEVVKEQNWNAEWEKSFEPVIVEGFCTIRAHFHTMDVKTIHDIVITPRMSFGTGHHATTQLMIETMKDISFNDKKVLDFGTGTGVLAILAEKLGAASITAIDNDEWSYSNAIDNCKQNDSKHIEVAQGSLEDIGTAGFDIILANINRHILLQYMTDMYNQLSKGGNLLLSGVLTEDEHIIKDAATSTGFRYISKREKNNWLCIAFSKA